MAKNTTLPLEWHVKALSPPNLPTSTWQVMNVLALLLVVMALTQLKDFNLFAGDLNALGVGGGNFWPAVIAGAELWAIASLLRLPLSRAFRMVSATLLVAISAFWFLLSVSAVVQSNTNLDFGIFGNFADIKADMWMVIFTAAFLGVSLWAANLVMASKPLVRVAVSKKPAPVARSTRKKAAAKRRTRR